MASDTEDALPMRESRLLVEQIFNECAALGMREIVVCPGSRNSVFVQALATDSRFRVYYWPEERSAAFFALGCTKRSGVPTPVITTSGTAVAELLPALMEAYYTGVALLAITADRPRRLRGSGAPQSAEQKEIFLPYLRAWQDLSVGEACSLFSEWKGQGPAHLNVCLEDPRSLEGDFLGPMHGATWSVLPYGSMAQFEASLRNSAAPLAVVGSLDPEERECVVTFLRSWGIPCYLEATSGLRENSQLALQQLFVGEAKGGFFPHCSRCGYEIDLLIRLGGLPTVRFWRECDIRVSLPVFSFSEPPFMGMSHGWVSPLSPLSLLSSPLDVPQWLSRASLLLAEDRRRSVYLESISSLYPHAEPALFCALSRLVPQEALLFLGNGLSIREWDVMALHSQPHRCVYANRGQSGIEGLFSTFFGLCREKESAWGIFGDLSSLYDMVSPWILSQIPSIAPVCVIINNGGGQIFSRMYREKEFLNEHALSFAPWADFWGLKYHSWKEVPPVLPEEAGKVPLVIELSPDPEQTILFWEAADL